MKSQWADALLQALSDFDGRSTRPLERFAAAHEPDAEMVSALCEFSASGDQAMQAAATWLLKRYGVTGSQLTPDQNDALLRLLLQETSWFRDLHILQMMDRLVLPESLAPPLMDALAAQAAGSNAFIRAWSVHGAVAIADQHPAFRERAWELLAAAERDEAASVKARARRLRKSTRWLS